jgi:hypothetical protein
MLKNINIHISSRDFCPNSLISDLRGLNASISIEDPHFFQPKGLHLYFLMGSKDPRSMNARFPERSVLICEKPSQTTVYDFLKSGFIDVFISPINFIEFTPKLFFLHEKCLSLEITHLKKAILKKIDGSLTKKEGQILELLLSTQNCGVTRMELNEHCWPGLKFELKALDVHLFNLRRKLEPKGITVEYSKGKWFLKGIADLI